MTRTRRARTLIAPGSPSRALAAPAWAVAALLAPLSLAAYGCAADGDTPGYEILPGMVESVPVDPYDGDPRKPSAPALRKPADGTLPMGWEPFPYGSGREEAERAGRELSNPHAGSDAELTRGAWLYATFCQVCHGPRGDGDGPIIGRYPNPPSLRSDRAKAMPDGQMFHIVTKGQGIMPAYAVQVRPDDRWKVILYVRSLQEGRK